MTERYTGIPENLKSTREASGGAYGRQSTEGSRSSFSSSGQTREQRGSARENIHNMHTDMRERFRSSRQGTLEEIRDLLRKQAITHELESMAAFRANLQEKFDRKREAALPGGQEREENATVGQWLLSLLFALLSAPGIAAVQTFEETKKQAEAAQSA